MKINKKTGKSRLIIELKNTVDWNIVILLDKGLEMHRYFLFFEITFCAIMVLNYGWTAGIISLVFIILSAIANVSREQEQQEAFNRQLFSIREQIEQECQKNYTDILDEVPGCADLIASYYHNKNKKNENFLIVHAKSKKD